MIFAIGDYVEYGLGRLGIIISSPKIKWRATHYLVRPLSITAGDGCLPAWYPELRIKVADMARWEYSATRNVYSRKPLETR
jgi:hypothetical protein